MAIYNEIEYWNKRQYPNNPNLGGKISQKLVDENTERHINYVRKHVDGLNRILVLGPGIGRVFPAYNRVKFVEGFDISSLYKDRVIKEGKRYDFEFTLTIKKQVGLLPYKEKEFDASIAVMVLLHQRPVNIVKVMSELIRVSKKAIIISFHRKGKRFDDPDIELKKSTHCYNYSYLDICKVQGWVVEDVIFTLNGIYFVFK